MSMQGKGEKSQGKFKALDINNLYKGTSVAPQKSTPANSRQHGLQSLGKVANLRRMPPPAHLPSLKSENYGNTETNVVLSDSGWTKEDITAEASSCDTIQLKSPMSPASLLSQELIVEQMPDNHQNRAGLSAITASGLMRWNSGGRKLGNFLDQKTSQFQDEFPHLSNGGEEKSGTPKTEDENKETMPKLGLNLRPQNEGSWKDVGSQAPMVLTSEDQHPSKNSRATADSDTGQANDSSNQTNQSCLQFRGSVPVIPGRPGLPPPSHHIGQIPFVPPNFHPLMMPFGFRPGFPPTYPKFLPPGVPRPSPFINQREMRFQGMYHFQGWNYACRPGSITSSNGAVNEVLSDRPTIVKDKDLEDFDRLTIADDGWARSSADVDYSELLVFSDEEDILPTIKSKKVVDENRLNNCCTLSSHTDGEKEVDVILHEESLNVQCVDGHNENNASALPANSKEAWGPANVLSQQLRPPFSGDADQFTTCCQGQRITPQYPRMRSVLTANVPTTNQEPDEEEMWRWRRKLQSESMSAAIERARQRRDEEEKRMKEEQTAAARDKLRHLDEKLNKIEIVDPVRVNQTSKSDLGQYMTAEVTDTGVREESPPLESFLPGPLQQQITNRLPAPPRATTPGYWSCDPRSWSAMPLPPRYMFDHRMFLISARGPMPAMPLCLPLRHSSGKESSSDSHDVNMDFADQSSVRAHWYDHNAMGIFPRTNVGSFEQHAARDQDQFVWVDTSPQNFGQTDNLESGHRLSTDRSSLCDDPRESLELEIANLPDSSLTITNRPVVTQSIDRNNGDGSVSFFDNQIKVFHESNQHEKSFQKSATKKIREFGISDTLNAGHSSADLDADRGNNLKENVQLSEESQNEIRRCRQKRESCKKDYQDDCGVKPNQSGAVISVAAVKRTHSNASNSSAASGERKADSPRSRQFVERLSRKYDAERRSRTPVSQEVQKSSWITTSQSSALNTSPEEGQLDVSEQKLALAAVSGLVESALSDRSIIFVTDDDETTDRWMHTPVNRSPAKRMKNGAKQFRRRKESVESERTRVSVGSWEFVRGGRTKVRGTNRSRGQAVHNSSDVLSDSRFYDVENIRAKDENHGVRFNSKEFSRNKGTNNKKTVDFEPVANSLHLQEARAGSEKTTKFERSQRGKFRSRDPRDETRLFQKSKKSGCQSKQSSSNISDLVVFHQSVVSNQSIEQPLAKSNDHQSNLKTNSLAHVDSQEGQRSRTSGGRSRRKHRLQDKPKPQMSDESGINQAVNENHDQQRVETNKSESVAVQTDDRQVTVDEAVERLNNDQLSKRPVGSHRRRRSRLSRVKRGAGIESSAAAVTAEMTSSDCDVSDQLKLETKFSQQANHQLTRNSSASDEKPMERVRVREANASKGRQTRGPVGRTSFAKSSPQKHGQLLEQMSCSSTCGTAPTNAGGINEEWETASESSDVLRGLTNQQHRNHRKNRDKVGADRRESKKSFSNQRPGHSCRSEETEHRGKDCGRGIKDSGTCEGDRGNSVEMKNDNDLRPVEVVVSESATVSSSGGPLPCVQNNSVHTVCRLDRVIYNNPLRIQDAFRAVNNRFGNSTTAYVRHESDHISDIQTTSMQLLTGSYCFAGIDESSMKSTELETITRQLELPLSISRFVCSGHRTKVSDIESNQYILRNDSVTTDIKSVVSSSDYLDSGVDISDLSNSSCCGSLCEDYCPDSTCYDSSEDGTEQTNMLTSTVAVTTDFSRAADDRDICHVNFKADEDSD